MKFLIVPIILLSFSAKAESEEKICTKLQEQAYNQCVQYLCEEYSEENVCPRDGDFHVAASECAYEEKITLIESYNAKHPRNKVSCENY